ncbi:MAG: DDE-type integrase/transposase/recombinase [Breznakia sp.]
MSNKKTFAKRKDRNFYADNPNEKMLTDITEFSIPAGKVYLSAMVDCFDGLVSVWTVGTTPNALLVNTMLAAYHNSLVNTEAPLIHRIEVGITEGQGG